MSLSASVLPSRIPNSKSIRKPINSNKYKKGIPHTN